MTAPKKTNKSATSQSTSKQSVGKERQVEELSSKRGEKGVDKSHVSADGASDKKKLKKMSTTDSPFIDASKQADAPIEATKAILLKARTRRWSLTSVALKVRNRKSTPIVFTLQDVQALIKRKKEDFEQISAQTPTPFAEKSLKKPVVEVPEPPRQARTYGAASVADILGFNPKSQAKASFDPEEEARKINPKYVEFYRLLIDLRAHVMDGLMRHTQETLKRSTKEDTGDLSSYGQHMADAGTDSFDRDFALSLVSNEQEALYEIEEAIRRIKMNAYGACEITGKPIPKERLRAVPFTRYSLEGQQRLEVDRRRHHRSSAAGGLGLFSEVGSEDSPALGDDEE